MKRISYLCGGYTALLLGMLGVVLPLLPTTPFILLAAFCFSRSSEALHLKLLQNKVFGKLIRDWETHGIIPMKAKCLSTFMMLAMISYPLIFRSFHPGLKLVIISCISLSLAYIWSRPSYSTEA